MALFLPQRWRQQPQYPVDIDWGNSICSDMRFCYIPTAGPLDLVRRIQGNWLGGVRQNKSAIGGTTADWNETASLWFERDSFLEPPDAFTVLGVTNYVSATLYARPIGKTFGNDATSPFVSYDFEYNGGQANRITYNANISGFRQAFFDPGTTALARVNTIATSYNAVSRLNGYFDGVMVASENTVGTIGYDTTSSGRLIISGSSAAAVRNPSGSPLYMAAVWGRRLTNEEQLALSVRFGNPWQLFKPIVARIYSFPSGPINRLGYFQPITFNPVGNF